MPAKKLTIREHMAQGDVRCYYCNSYRSGSSARWCADKERSGVDSISVYKWRKCEVYNVNESFLDLNIRLEEKRNCSFCFYGEITELQKSEGNYNSQIYCKKKNQDSYLGDYCDDFAQDPKKIVGEPEPELPDIKCEDCIYLSENYQNLRNEQSSDSIEVASGVCYNYKGKNDPPMPWNLANRWDAIPKEIQDKKGQGTTLRPSPSKIRKCDGYLSTKYWYDYSRKNFTSDKLEIGQDCMVCGARYIAVPSQKYCIK